MEQESSQRDKDILLHLLYSNSDKKKWEIEDIKKKLLWEEQRIVHNLKKCEEENSIFHYIDVVKEIIEVEKTYYFLFTSAPSTANPNNDHQNKNDIYYYESSDQIYHTMTSKPDNSAISVSETNNSSKHNYTSIGSPTRGTESITENFINLITDYQIDILKVLEVIQKQLLKQNQEDSIQENINHMIDKFTSLEKRVHEINENTKYSKQADKPKSNGKMNQKELNVKNSPAQNLDDMLNKESSDNSSVVKIESTGVLHKSKGSKKSRKYENEIKQQQVKSKEEPKVDNRESLHAKQIQNMHQSNGEDNSNKVKIIGSSNNKNGLQEDISSSYHTQAQDAARESTNNYQSEETSYIEIKKELDSPEPIYSLSIPQQQNIEYPDVKNDGKFQESPGKTFSKVPQNNFEDEYNQKGNSLSLSEEQNYSLQSSYETLKLTKKSNENEDPKYDTNARKKQEQFKMKKKNQFKDVQKGKSNNQDQLEIGSDKAKSFEAYLVNRANHLGYEYQPPIKNDDTRLKKENSKRKDHSLKKDKFNYNENNIQPINSNKKMSNGETFVDNNIINNKGTEKVTRQKMNENQLGRWKR